MQRRHLGQRRVSSAARVRGLTPDHRAAEKSRGNHRRGRARISVCACVLTRTGGKQAENTPHLQNTHPKHTPRETRLSVWWQSPTRGAVAAQPAWSHVPVAARRTFPVSWLLFCYS